MMQMFSWRRLLRLIAILTLLIAIGWVYFEPGFEPLLAVLGAVVAFITSFFVEGSRAQADPFPSEVTLYDADCGSKGVDLAEQRLRVSAAFGPYFTGLLEREEGYVTLAGQIDCPTRKGQEGLPPIQRIFWSLQDPKGARVLIVAADGGMGKSTLASKLVRCLYDQEAVDMILGDSAKSEVIDPVTGQLLTLVPGYDSLSGFYHRLCEQIGVPYESDQLALKDIRRRLVNRRAVIVVDNLDTVTYGDQLLRTLVHISGRDIRAIVTTRQATGLSALDSQHLLIRLNALQDSRVVGDFLNWHIDQYQHTHPALTRLRDDVADKKKFKLLVELSGGIPLLIQLLVSYVARSSWEQLRQLPIVFGPELLNYLYEAHWQELEKLGETGSLAQKILMWLKQEQFYSRRTTSKRLAEWAQELGKSADLPHALALLHERFLILNSDSEKGNYSIFPSLSEFLHNYAQAPSL
jgi:hypothetical protein